ncbi:hypothetical protein BHM03_00053696 [Ensete ventricosum]|nr:hypothetical protein BHM03_00053696 [Ensete ventricosum]
MGPVPVPIICRYTGMDRRARWGKPDFCLKQLQVGCKCKLALAVGAAHEERDNKQDKRDVGYSLQAEEAQSRVPTGKRSHKERLTMAEIRLDVLEASLEELYQGQRRLLGVESWQEETES